MTPGDRLSLDVSKMIYPRRGLAPDARNHTLDREH